MSLALTISTKEHNPSLHFKNHKVLISNDVKTYEKVKEDLPFLVKRLQKEVTKGSQKQQLKRIKSLKMIQRTFVSMLGIYMVTLPIPTFAQTQEENTPLTTMEGQEITPDIITGWGFKIALLAVSIGVAISGTLLATAGVYRMFRKREEAEEWTTDIIKGLVQVLIALPTVYALFHLAQIVFQALPALNTP